MMANWRDLTNDELAKALLKIVHRCDTADEVNRMAKDELGYTYRIAVSYSEPNGAGQRMSMFMAHAKDGSTLT